MRSGSQAIWFQLRSLSHVKADSISIGMDDRQDYRILRARVAYTEDKVIRSQVLVLGVHRVSGAHVDSTLEDLDKSYPQQVVECTEKVLRCFCGESWEAVRSKIHLLCGDGCPALQKSLRLHIQQLLPAVVLIVRDGCHAARIATKEPLRAWQYISVLRLPGAV
jgi:hypothetical protein